MFSSRSYAIGMAHYRISGGLRSVLTLGALYVVGVLGVISLVAYNSPPGRLPRALSGVATMLFILQSFVLVLFGATRVAGCIRSDAASNMLESHRLMPIPSWFAVLSYMFGSTVHVIAFVLLNVGFMSGLVAFTGISFERFVLGQVVLIAFALFTWTLAAMSTLAFRQVAALMLLGIIFGGVGSILLQRTGLAPGVSILFTPFLGETIFILGSIPGTATVRDLYPIGMASQAAFGALFFIGACRRYRGAYLTTFNAPMGIALVAVWALLSSVGIYQWRHTVFPLGVMEFQPGLHAQIVSGLVICAVLMIVPLHALATWEGRHGVSGRNKALVIGGTVAAGFLQVLPGGVFSFAAMMTLLILLFFGITIFSILRLVRTLTPMNAGVVVGGMVMLIWFGPLVVEWLRWVMSEEAAIQAGKVEGLTLISTFGPLGLLLALWDPSSDLSPYPGLAIQAILAGLVWKAARGSAKKPSLAAAGG